MVREASRYDLVFGGSAWGPRPRSSHSLQRQGSEAANPFSPRH